MATNVTHRLPTPQDQAIADLTGYEDIATVGKRKARYPCGYVSSRSPFRTVREAFTSYGSTLSDQTWSSLCGMVCIQVEGYPCYQPS